MNLKEIFNRPRICAIIGDANEAKSNTIYWMVEQLKKDYNFNLVTYGLRNEIKGAKKIFSVNELEEIENSVIFLDEFFSLFDLDDRKKKRQVENSLRLIFHHNNILILSGLPENFKKFISAKISTVFYKKCTIADFINGSSIKRSVIDYSGNERGFSILNLKKGEVLMHNGSYHKFNVPYLLEYDSKKNNVEILVHKKNVLKSGD